MKFFVSRQFYYYGGHRCVEVAVGGRDYAGSDMLAPFYFGAGEGTEFTDPREAVEMAIKIQEDWKQTAPTPVYMIAGSGKGMLTQLIGDDASDAMDATEMRAWAEEVYAKLPKCDNCGELIDGEPFTLDGDDSWVFCSMGCEYNYRHDRPFGDDGLVDFEPDIMRLKPETIAWLETRAGEMQIASTNIVEMIVEQWMHQEHPEDL